MPYNEASWLKQYKPWRVPDIVGSFMVIGVLIYCVFFHWVCDLKATQMTVTLRLIQENMLYKLKLDHNAEDNKNSCCVKSEGTIGSNRITW